MLAFGRKIIVELRGFGNLRLLTTTRPDSGSSDFCDRLKKEGKQNIDSSKQKEKNEKENKCKEKSKKDAHKEKKEDKEKENKLKRQMEISGKVVMITGGASGIGKCVCKDLICRGAKVSIVDIDSKKGKALVDCINENMGCRAAIFCKADVTNLKKFKEAFKETESKLGCVNVLFNNAAIFDDSPKGWNREIDVNVKGVINGCIAAIEHMGSLNGGPGGAVINTASIQALNRTSMWPVYRASKAAVFSFTRSMGSEFHLKLNCIRYMALCPGFTETNMFCDIEKKLFIPGKDMQELIEKRKKEFVFQKPENVSKCALTMIEYGENGSIWMVEKDKEGQLTEIKNLKYKAIPYTTSS